ncbi:MAG: hypothetical protein V4687_01000 [Bacteroidota bacterium]
MNKRNLNSFSKTVYVLGAGFSMDANAPSQERIVEEIFKLDSRGFPFKDETINTFRKFLTDTLCIPENLHSKIPLEDIFTPLDRCLIENISFRNLDLSAIKYTRDLIYYLIATTLDQLLRGTDKHYIDVFASYLTKQSSVRSRGKFREVDNVSVLSTNWDILLDNSIYENIQANFAGNAVVDYCCYISSYDKSDVTIMPGLEMLGQGGFNVKLLKLHGSLNWLQCPKCHRLYVHFNEKIGVSAYEHPVECRHCQKHFGKSKSHNLTSNSIMPTFIKDLSNPQYKLIWQNAAIEISEATKIVFIGYSLPAADFEMRQLLSRMVRKDAVIEVVGYGNAIDDADVQAITQRYNVFFGDRLIQPIYIGGAKKYVLENFN